MAITSSRVKWPTNANTVTISSASEVESEVIDFNNLGFEVGQVVGIQLSVNNSGTPGAGDTAVVKVKWSTGDVNDDTGDDYDTIKNSQLLAVLDTYSTNPQGEDPAARTLSLYILATKAKLSVVCANAATRNMVLAALINY